MLTRSKQVDHAQLARFGVVGLLNMAVGYSVIVAALLLGAGDVPANATGYAVGLLVSYVLNSRWTFRTASAGGMERAARYGAVFAIAYSANLAVVFLGRQLGYPENPLVHLVSNGVYTATFYLGAAHFVFDDRAATACRRFLKQRWPEILVLCGIGAAWGFMRHVSVASDVVWQMWIARQLLGGASLYQDILENNPPLWFWLAMPVQKLAELLGLLPKHAMVAAVFVYIAIAQLLLASLIAGHDAGRRAWLLAVTAVAAIIIPIMDFAQREHLVLVAAIPYCALIARRAEGRDVPWWLATAVGLFAALAFALKHYFVAPLVLLEIWLLWRRRRSWNPFRPELVALGGAAALYAAAIYLLAPAYLTTIVPMLTLAYSAYGQPLLRLLVNPYTIFWVVGALALYGLRSRRDSLSMAYIIAAVGFAFCYFIQNKGFLYHVIPTTGLLFIALGIMLPSQKQARNSSVVFVGTMSALLVAWIMPLLFGFMITSKTEDLEAVEDLLRGTPRGASIIMLTVDPWRIWPMVEDQGYAWPSRYFSLWMLPAFALEKQANGNLSLPMQELARDVRAQTAADLTCNPPELIIVDDVRQLRAKGIDMLAFFAEDDEFRRFFANYEKAETRTVGTDHQFASFVRRPGWQPTAPAAGCRKIH